MEDLEFVVVKKKDDLMSQVLRIYHQHDINHDGIFDNKCIFGLLEDIAFETATKNYYVCAMKGDNVIGFVSLMEGYIEGSLYIAVLAVDKDYQKQGIGSALVNYALHHSKGFPTVSVECMGHNDNAVKLYEKIGFDFVLSYEANTVEHGLVEQYLYRYLTDKITENDYINYTDVKSLGQNEERNKKFEQENVNKLDKFKLKNEILNVRKETRRDKKEFLGSDYDEEKERKGGDENEGSQR